MNYGAFVGELNEAQASRGVLLPISKLIEWDQRGRPEDGGDPRRYLLVHSKGKRVILLV